jgi:glycosyltransferase involved in cell wall biosynthesis
MVEVSVVIPSYNHEEYIKEAIQSVLNQTYKDIELIVVDDGSTDNSPRVLSELKHERVKIVFQNNQGAHAAINLGLSLANGKYLAILNSDDVYYPQRIEKALDVLQKNPQVGLVSSYLEIINAEGIHLDIKQGYHTCHPWTLDKPEKSFRSLESSKLALLTENYLASTSNFIFPRILYKKIGGFKPLRYTHDWDFALRIARESEIYLIREPLLKYRVHQRNTIREDQITMIFEICWTLAVNLPNFFDSQSLRVTNFDLSPLEAFINSLYTFGCGDVLSVMLLQRLYQNQAYALSLLHPENPDRLVYLEAIQRIIEKSMSNNQCANIVTHHSLTNSIIRLLRSITKKLSV